jgi:hypothetical protein
MSSLKENVNHFRSDVSVTSVKESNFYFAGNKSNDNFSAASLNLYSKFHSLPPASTLNLYFKFHTPSSASKLNSISNSVHFHPLHP